MSFTGLSAFPLTPLTADVIDDHAFAALVRRLASAKVDSITALGSTGCYPYFSRAERAHVARLAVEHAGSTPVFVGVGALRTSHVLAHAQDAEQAGAAGLLLAPMTYQALTDDEVHHLFRALTESTTLPVIVYDNPGTTHFSFSAQLYARIAALPGIASIKIPALPADPDHARARVAEIRSVIPEHVSIGISGDASAAAGLAAGCDAWYSVIGGTLPQPALTITRAALGGDVDAAHAESARLTPMWDLFRACGGSLRVIAAVAEILGLARRSSLPAPLLGLDDDERARLAVVLQELELAP